MKNSFYKAFGHPLLLILVFSITAGRAIAQEPSCPSGFQCFTFDARMDLQKAMNFDINNLGTYGILAPNVSASSFIIRIDVYSKDKITWYHGPLCTSYINGKLYLFGGEVNQSNVSASYELRPIWDNANGGFKSYTKWNRNFLGCWSADADGVSEDVIKENAKLLYYKTAEDLLLDNGGGFYSVGDVGPTNVTIKLSIQGGVNLNEIDGIKIPAVNQDDVDEIIELMKYTNPCDTDPNHPGCQAVADWKDTSSDAKRKTLVVAHRGYHGMRGVPENSLSAVSKAYDERYRYMEVDIRRSRDGHPFIFHDDFLGYATNHGALNNIDPNTFISSHDLHDLQLLFYRTRYWDGNYSSAINSSGKTVNARVGNISVTPVNSLADIFDYVKGKDIMLYLDIKDVPTEENLKTMKECIKIAMEKGVLHQIAIKMIRTNAGAPPDKQLVMPVDKAEELLGAYYSILKNNLNIHIVDYRPNEEISFIHDWINEGNVVGFEFDSNVSGWNAGINKSFYQAPAFGDKVYTWNNTAVCAWEYTKLQGYRTGLWSSGPIDPRGRPGHDPSKWSIGGAMNRRITNDQHYADIRSRFEIQMTVSPQYITQDRPNIWVSYLQAVGQLNDKTFRP